MTRHGLSIMRYKQSAVFGSQCQHRFVTHAGQLGGVRRLKIDAWLSPQDCLNYDLIEIGVGLKANLHERDVCNCRRASAIFCENVGSLVARRNASNSMSECLR